MEQEKRLKIDLARLKNESDAASVTNPSLFWSRVLAG